MDCHYVRSPILVGELLASRCYCLLGQWGMGMGRNQNKLGVTSVHSGDTLSFTWNSMANFLVCAGSDFVTLGRPNSLVPASRLCCLGLTTLTVTFQIQNLKIQNFQIFRIKYNRKNLPISPSYALGSSSRGRWFYVVHQFCNILLTKGPRSSEQSFRTDGGERWN